MTKNNNTSAAFHNSVLLMLQLHDVMTNGDPDGQEADAIRDSMEQPWYAMAIAEQQLVRGLSADLYTIGRPSNSMQKHALPTEELQNFVQADNWSAVLDLVRSNQAILSSDEAAFVRAVTWMHLEEPEVALYFFKELQRIRPLSENEMIWVLTCVMQTGRIEECREAAVRFAESSNPLVRLRASNALSLVAQALSNGDSLGVRLRAIAVAEEALPKIEPLIDEDATAKVLRQSSLFQLALDYEELGDAAKAASYCERLLKEQPNHFDAQILMDWLLYQHDPEKGSAQFRRHLRQRLPEQGALDLTSLPAMAYP